MSKKLRIVLIGSLAVLEFGKLLQVKLKNKIFIKNFTIDGFN
jgi:hypothetical protein